MSLQFILGGSGSGKSEYLYRKVTEEASKNPKKNYLVLVPEQFTLATQQKLVALSPNKAIMNVDVLSFKRLAYRVFDDMGKSDIPILEETGKNLLIRRIAQEQDEKLTVLHHNMSRMGYVDQMKSLISEFVQYNVTPAMLHEMENHEELSRSFIAKLKDVTLLYEYFLEAMKDHYYMAEEVLNVLAELAPQSELLRDSVIVFDEFTGFTPIQYDLLRRLLPVAEVIYIALTIDPKEVDKKSSGIEDLFDMTKTTVEKMQRISAEEHIDVLPNIIMKSTKECRFVDAPGLFHLETYMFRPYYKKYQESPDDIIVTNVATPREEVIYVAREIQRFIRNEEFRYRDIAVVTGDLATYGTHVKEIFERYNVPCFVDSTREVTFSPFTECVRAILEIVESGFSYESVMRFLRTGFTDLDVKDIDALDNYLLATGICRRSQWENSWLGRRGKSKSFDLTQMDEIRRYLMNLLKPILVLTQADSATNGQAIEALYQILITLHSFEKLEAMAERYMEMGLETKAKEYEQVYNKVVELLDKYYELLGEEPYYISEFIELLEAGMSALKLAATPPGFDSVIVGDIERTRLNGPKIMFFIGINEGVIPKSATNGGIISEYERQTLLESGMDIAPGLREKAFIQRYYLYRNLTKPSKKLYLSYARSDSDGKKLQKSYLIKDIEKMFPCLVEISLSELVAVKDFSSPIVAMEYLSHSVKDEDWYATAKALEHDVAVSNIVQAPYVSYEGNTISKNISRALYGENLSCSISRIETFYRCAYKHFVQYGLKLQQREEAGLQPFDIGDLYHEALEIAGKQISKEKAWNIISVERCAEIADESMDQALFHLGHAEFVKENLAETHYLNRMKKIFQRNLQVIVTQVRKGEFRPESFELRFGSGKDADTDLKFSLKDGKELSINGKIDRIDTLKRDEKLLVKIVDYKTGATGSKFDMKKIYYGLQLQLAVYMNALLDQYENSVPAAMLYQPIGDPILESGMPNELNVKVRPIGRVNNDIEVCCSMDQQLSENGYESYVVPVKTNKNGGFAKNGSLLTEDEFRMVSEYAIMKMREGGEQIVDGEVSAAPIEEESSCKYCDYKGICGFDKKIRGYENHKHPKLGKEEEILSLMETDLALYQNKK